MKKPELKSAILITLLGAAQIFISCKKTDTIGPEGTPLAPVKSLKAYSASATSVGLSWTASTSVSDGSIVDHLVTAKNPAGTVVRSTTAGFASTSVLVDQLSEGTLYTFEVVARPDPASTIASNSPGTTIVWSPASRFDTDGGFPIQLYETKNPLGRASCLAFLHPGAGGPKTISFSSPGGDSLKADVYVLTGDSTSLTIQSASLHWPNGGRMTRFSSVTRDAVDLDDAQAAPPDTNTYLSTNLAFAIDSSSTLLSRILFFKGNDGNYGRLLVRRDPSSSRLLWGTYPNRYLTVKISYQSVAYNRFVKTK